MAALTIMRMTSMHVPRAGYVTLPALARSYAPITRLVLLAANQRPISTSRALLVSDGAHKDQQHHHIPHQHAPGHVHAGAGHQHHGRSDAEKKIEETGAGPHKSEGSWDRLKRLSKQYGWPAFGIYIGLGTITLSACYVAVSNGLNVAELMGSLGITSGPWLNPTSGTFVISYAIHKVCLLLG